MSKKLNISQVLVYFDFPEIFIAMDEIGTNYLCLLVELDEENTKYIASAISQKRLARFLNGIIDLREIFVEPELEEWYYFYYTNDEILAELWQEAQLPEEYLPEQGFTYEKDLVEEELIQQEVIEKNNAVVHLAISDKEDNHSIGVKILGDIINSYQKIIENAYKKVLTKKSPKEKKELFTPNNFQLRAFAASPGSFNIHLYSNSYVNLWGNANIEYGLNKFDEILKDFNNQDAYIDVLKTVQGRTISNLRNLTKQLIDNEIKIKYKWLSPASDKVNFTIIDKTKAEKILEVINLSEELEEEIIILEGHFVQVDIEKGTWRILNKEDNEEYKGEATKELLQGVTVKTVTYRITCQEKVEEYKVTEKEQTNHIIQSIEQLGE